MFTCFRYIRSRNFNLNNAKKLFKKYIDFLKEKENILN